jgi:Protein of unknown function (DUF1566)
MRRSIHPWCFQVLSVVGGLLCTLLIPAVGMPDTVRFQDNGNGTVSDLQTGLMWQKGDSFKHAQKGLSWYQAWEYVDKKNGEKFAGYNDWRLPTLDELHGIWDPNLPLKSKDGEPIGLPAVFADSGSYYLWTSNERNLDHAWYFGLGQKEDYFNLKETGDLDQGVKMVRKIQ